MEHHAITWLLSLPLLSHDPAYVHINAAILVFAFILVLSLVANRLIVNRMEHHLVPSPRAGIVSLTDVTIEGLHNMVTGTLGHSGEKYFPFVSALFLFVLFSNCLGLIPLAIAPTANINTTLSLGIAAFVYYNIMGIREHGVAGYLKHFLMGLGPAGVLVALLEIASQLVRPFSLAVRLYANMFVDHTVSGKFAELLAFFLPVPLILFGIVVATIQAFVFAILTAVYVQMATEHEEH